MSAIFKFDFQKRKQLHFSGENYLNYTKKGIILHVKITFSLKQGGGKNKQWTHLGALKSKPVSQVAGQNIEKTNKQTKQKTKKQCRDTRMGSRNLHYYELRTKVRAERVV